MNDWLDSLARHGVALLAGVCFLEAIGLPLPAAVALLTSGALIDQGKMTAAAAFLAASSAFLTGDLLYYTGGRYTGWWLLGLLCKVSVNPENCILSSAEKFYRKGRTVLVFAKFVPGLNTMAPPLAGSMRMRFGDFLWLDLAGVFLYVGVYLGLGYAFSDVLSKLLDIVGRAGSVVTWVMVSGFAAYLLYRIWLRWRSRSLREIPRVRIDEIDGPVMDVRSHGYYETGAKRIPGARRLEPNRLPEGIHELPESEKIYLYCT